jgi:hypothetical protein
LKTLNSGIYVLRNRINGKIYVGQSGADVDERSRHRGCHRKWAIDLALCKYGTENFDRFVYYVPEELLDDFEREMIRKLNSIGIGGYNLTTGGCQNHHLSEETKKKIGKAFRGKSLSEEHKRKIGAKSAGRRLSEETKKKISVARKGKKYPNAHPMLGKKHSEETKRKMSDAHRGERSQWFGTPGAFFGKRHSEETKKKMRETWAGRRERERAA